MPLTLDPPWLNRWTAAGLLLMVCLGVYWPSQKAEFVLDDYYTVVRNPLIKNPSLYGNIWTSRLFDAHPSSGYIKFGYYRPVLQSSWILDYRLFGLKAAGFQWMNLLIHALNCFLVFILVWQIFGQVPLAVKTSALFCVLPNQEWVVRYVTGRGDELSALFALVSLVFFAQSGMLKNKAPYLMVAFIGAVLSALTREIALSYFLYAFLIYHFPPSSRKFLKASINHFSLYWILIGLLPLVVVWPLLPKLGNILALHFLYFASIGLCLWMAQLPLRWCIILFLFCSVISVYEGRFWTSEENLLRHTQSLEAWPRTVTAQQLLMKYDENIPAIIDIESHAQDPLIKAMWLRRLGVVYFNHGDLPNAERYFSQALLSNPTDIDTLNALAVAYHNQGREAQSLKCLKHSLEINSNYPDTLRTLGIHYFDQKDFSLARLFLSRCLVFEPDNVQARTLLREGSSDRYPP